MNPILKLIFMSKTVTWILGLFLAFASFGLMQESMPFGILTLIGSILLLPPIEKFVAQKGVLIPMWVKPALTVAILITFNLIIT